MTDLDKLAKSLTKAQREAAARLCAASELRPLLLSGEHDDHLYGLSMTKETAK